MDKYAVLFIGVAIVFTILILIHINYRVKKYKSLFGDKYEKILSELQKANLPKDIGDKELKELKDLADKVSREQLD